MKRQVGDVELKNHDDFKLNLNLTTLSNSEPWNIKDGKKKGFRTLSGFDEIYDDYLGRRKRSVKSCLQMSSCIFFKKIFSNCLALHLCREPPNERRDP